MGRIVYFSLPAHGHINPTLPVIRELVRRQQPVTYYGTERFRRAIEDTGAEFRPYSADFDMPEQGPGPFARVSTTLETLLDLTRAALDGHVEEVRTLRPTHIMYDSFAPWGGLVAELLQLPSIASIPSILVNADIDSRYRADSKIQPRDPRLTPWWYALFRARCQAVLSSYPLRQPLSPPQLLQTYGDLNLVYTSRLFQPSPEAFDERRVQFVGLCVESRRAAQAFPFDRLDDRPLILVSLGTVYGNRPQFFRSCLEELANTPWQVVMSTGGNSLEGHLCRVPENFIVRSFVPQIEILRRCSAFITHAGMNSVQESLYYGVPLVMAPQAADQFWISARVAELGAGLVIESPLKARAIRSSVAEVLSDIRYAAAAARIGASLQAAGGYGRAADEIQNFMDDQRYS